MHEVFNYIKKNENTFTKELQNFLKIPSISTDSKYKNEMKSAINFLVEYLEESHFQKIETIETEKHPIVFAEYQCKDKSAPTVLIYGHYDVQPVEPLEQWETNPFDPEIINGRIYARGASDDKGQVFMHLAVLRSFLKTKGDLPVNVKVLIEGEEEIGSPNLLPILKENKEKFKSDLVIISDSAMIQDDQPTIIYGLKGLIGFEIVVTGPNKDLHSGVYGGAIKNPAFALTEILQKLKNEDEQILIPNFYDRVIDLTDEEKQMINDLPKENLLQTTGVQHLVSEKGYTASEHRMARPTLEINGLTSGYQAEGIKTIIPQSASAKITCRLVPNQDPNKILENIQSYIDSITPNGVKAKVKIEESYANPILIDPNHPYIQKAANSFSETFGKETVFVRIGGSIPVVEWLDRLFNVPIVLLGFGTPDDQIHAPNESFPLKNFTKGMLTLVHYLHSLKQNN